MNLGVSGTLGGEGQPASYEGNDFGCRGAGSALRRPRRRGSLQRRTRICTGLPSTSVLGSPESMKCLSLQTSQGVVFSEAGRYYTLTPGRAVRKRRASASEGRSESDRAERLDAPPSDSLSEEGPVAWRVDRRIQGVLHAIEKSLTRCHRECMSVRSTSGIAVRLAWGASAWRPRHAAEWSAAAGAIIPSIGGQPPAGATGIAAQLSLDAEHGSRAA